MSQRIRACFVSASGQNLFVGEMLDAFRAALERHGVPTEHAVDHFPAPEQGLVYVFVPHEYIPLTHSEAHPSAEQLRRTVAISTESPGSEGFEEASYVARREGVVTIDINHAGVAEFRSRGLEARFMQLGYVPEWDRWGGDPDSERPIDVTFMGGYSPRRAAVIARCAPYLRKHRVAMHLYETWTPHTEDSASFFSGNRKWDHLSRSKLVLNVHRGERDNLGWQHLVGAVANGCVFVTEHSLGYEPLVPGEHFVTGTRDSLPLLVAGLLEDPDWIAAVRDKGYRKLRDEMAMTDGATVLADAVRELSDVPVRDRLTHPGAPKPRVLPLPPPEWIRLDRESNDLEIVRMGLKKVLLEQRSVLGRLRRLEEGDTAAPADGVTSFGPYAEADPKVTVAVTLYNYENVIEDALHSVALSDYSPFEVVVVDDRSTDGSLDAARAALSARPWMASKLVARAENGGLAVARNTAISHARGEYVFVLDADNAVYPHALERLSAALDEDPNAAFAYGPIEKFTSEGSMDLVSWLAWDPERLKYGNFVDAMSMIRRSAIEEAGGYSTDPRLWGWEDFDLWCSFADHNYHGAFVPEVLTRYRSGRHSMISLTNISTVEAWGLLLDRHRIFREAEVSV